ncbi:glycosyltransferase involved in cell wall biosynthesis [Bradyrhizobium sp. USDA 4449]
MSSFLCAALQLPDKTMTENVAAAIESDSGSLPLISVIITNFNYANYVGEAISSILAQTYAHVECVVVDDGSTDNSREVIESFSGIKSIFRSNAGQAQAGLAGLSSISGSIVVFLDSDDYLLPEACATIAANWSTGMAAALYRLKVLRDGKLSDEVLPSQNFVTERPQDFIRTYGYLPAAPMSGNAYAPDVVRRIFSDGLHLDKNGLDAYLILGSPFLGKVVAIDRPLGIYRVHSSNISMFAKPSLRSVKSRIYYEYWAQRTAVILDRSICGKSDRWTFLKGPYNLKWYILTKHIPFPEFDIPSFPLWKCVAECCREFVVAPNVSFRKRLLNCGLVFLFSILPRPVKTRVVTTFYRLDMPGCGNG